MRRASVFFLFAAVSLLAITGCGNIEGLSFPYVASPRVEVQTPASPAEGNITISFQLIDREVEQADVTVEYSTNGGTTYSTVTLTIPGDATNLASAWHPGKTHSVTWNSVTDMVGRSGAVSVCVKITPSDASNPSGTPGVSGSFTVNNIAYNEAPTATAATPAGVQTGNVQINYFLADVESDTCSIAVLYSTNDGTSYQAATMGPAGDGVSGLSSSPSGTAHVYLWDSRADNVAPSGQVDTIKIRITPTDFNAGTAGDTNSFSVDNSVANDPPTVAITGGPADGSTVTTTQVTFTWSGSDTDGSVVGYYYSFDHDPPDVWITDTTVTSGALSEASHTFRVVAVDDDSDLSAVASRSFTVSIPGTITAEFSGSPLSGPAPFDVSFTDLSTATNGITGWSWNFGNGDASTAQHPVCSYMNAGSYAVSLTVTGPDGTDNETKTDYITVTAPGGDTIYVDGVGGDDGKSGLDWANAVQTIQTGLDKAANGWTVLVKNGIYTGPDNKNLDFGGRSIHLKSAGGATACIIDCENSGRGFYFHSGESNTAIVEGFTIRNGNVSGRGGGISCNYCNPTITNCTITDNWSGLDGGGISCESNATPAITSCIITNNSASNFGGGGIFCYSSSPTITGCMLANNSGRGPGNNGGGICCTNDSSATIINCTIMNNSAYAGGGIQCGESNPTITNCSIVNNSASLTGGGINCFKSSPDLNNSIIWGNTGSTGDEICASYAVSIVTLKHCDYANETGDVEGDGTVTPSNCINLDPEFVNATAQDYHLQDISPCVDAGDNALVPPGVTTDLDGNARIANSIIDMGAYEYRPVLTQYGWTRRIGDQNTEMVTDSFVDGGNNIYLAGYFRGTVNFAADWGGFDERESEASNDAFVTRVDADGTYGWTRRFGSTGTDDKAKGVCADSSGNIYVAGVFGGTVNFAFDWGATDTKVAAGGSDAFVVKLGADGSYGWTRRIGGSANEDGLAICADPNGNVYLAGYFIGTANFSADWGGTDEKTSAASWDMYIVKINVDGSFGWVHRMGGTSGESAHALCSDSAGNIYAVGKFMYTVNFAQDWSGSDEKTSAGIYDISVTKIGPAGNYVRTHRVGGDGWDGGYAIRADSSDNVYLAGVYESTTVEFAGDWDGGWEKGNSGPGDADIFVAKVASDDTFLWARIMGDVLDDGAADMRLDAGGSVYITGYYRGTVNFAADWGGTDVKTSAGETDAYIAKLDSTGAYCWSHVMGAECGDKGNTIGINGSGDVFVAGYFGSDSYSGYTVNFAEDWGDLDEIATAGIYGYLDMFVTRIPQP